MLIYLQTLSSDAERTKLEALYRKYRLLMQSVAMKVLNNRQDAEDAVHQAFLSILKHLDKISDIHCPKTRAYVVIIVERKALDILRTKQRIVPTEPEELYRDSEPPLPGDNGLADAMAKLPFRYREALLLRYAYGYSTKELARHMNMNQDSVQKLIWRAKEALRKNYEEGGCDA